MLKDNQAAAWPAIKTKRTVALSRDARSNFPPGAQTFTLSCKHIPLELLLPGPSCQNSPCVVIPNAMRLSLSCSLPALAIALQEHASGSKTENPPICNVPQAERHEGEPRDAAPSRGDALRDVVCQVGHRGDADHVHLRCCT